MENRKEFADFGEMLVYHGRQQGLVEGERATLIRALTSILAKRFGTLPPEVLCRIEQAAPEQTESWFERVLDAASLADVFGDDAAHQ